MGIGGKLPVYIVLTGRYIKEFENPCSKIELNRVTAQAAVFLPWLPEFHFGSVHMGYLHFFVVTFQIPCHFGHLSPYIE
jgi:hypothetical protein